MRTRAMGTARAVLLTASFVALGASTAFPGSAFADTTSGDDSVLGGNQISAPISAPINACGNSLALFGAADASCKGGATVKNGGHGYGGGGQQTSGKHSVLGGNQATAPISAPVNVCGNAGGNAVASCKGGAEVKNGHGGGGNTTSGDGSVGGGNQLYAPVGAPVNVCGNAVAVAGNAGAFCEGGAEVKNGGGNTTSGDSSVLGGNQVNAPVKAPVNVCGNAVAVLGEAAAGCQGGNGGGGGYYHSRTSQRATGSPVAMGLPTVPGSTKAVPMNPAGALPGVPELPTDPTQLPVAHQAAPVPAPAQLPDLPQLPLVSDIELPAASQAIRPTAASEPMSSEVENGSLYVLTVGALMAAASAAMTFARRIRFGRR